MDDQIEHQELNNNDNVVIEPVTLDVNALAKKYQGNNYMLSRLNHWVTSLPSVLESEQKKYEDRVNRFNELTTEQDTFLKVFLSKHQYLYMPWSELFYEYDGDHYRVVSEDDIQHKLLSTITLEGKLVQWKHRTKQILIKKVKEQHLIRSMPESVTIQAVLQMLQAVFHTRTEAKYFLTLIGDFLLTKQSDRQEKQEKQTDNQEKTEKTEYVMFVCPYLRRLVGLLEPVIVATTGVNLKNNFITKYNSGHDITSYRILTASVNATHLDLLKPMLYDFALDLMVVASHYSDKYGGAEQFLVSDADPTISNSIRYFANHSREQMVKEFIDKCLTLTFTLDDTISWRNMHYLWKQYLSQNGLPGILYASELQTMLQSLLQHNFFVEGEPVQQFFGVSSKFLPKVSAFLSFWDNYIVIKDQQAEGQQGQQGQENVYEYEIDELQTLYKQTPHYKQISDGEMIKMIRHYFDKQVEIIDNKYITGIQCSLWLKNDDINEFLTSYKNTNSSDGELIPIDGLYLQYKKYIKSKSVVEQKTMPLVSKQYFEMFVLRKLAQWIQYEKFVSSEWIKS